MRKNKGKLILKAITSLIIIIALVIGAFFVVQKYIAKYTAQINELNYELDTNKQIVYVASTDITRGSVLEEGVNVEKQNIVSGLESNRYISETDLGKSTIVDISANLPILTNMITEKEIAQDTREVELSVVSIMTDQNENDVIDIRIMFPTGEDFLLLSKKDVKNLSLEGAIFFTYLNEEEILRLSSALVDAYTISGTKIYSVRYTEPTVQEKAIPNYPIRPETLDLINSDPNILTKATETMSVAARMDLETRLKTISQETLEAVAGGNDIADTANGSVLTDRQAVSEKNIESETETIINSEEDTGGIE